MMRRPSLPVRFSGRLPRILFRGLQQAADFAFPPECPVCGSQDPADFRGEDGHSSAFCGGCRRRLAPPILHACGRCGAEVGPYSVTLEGCVHCRRRTLAFDSVVCLGMYRDELQRALLSAKWSYSSVNMESLAALLWQHKAVELQQLQLDRILPIPQHWQQRLLRHFNPSWILGDLLSARLSIPCDVHIVRRCRRTRPQKRVAVHQRFENQRGAFRVQDAHLIRGQRLLLVDDVLTTGATCSEAARQLKAAGAAACHVCVVGRVLDHSA